ncbi:intradiol ring-cleavage dioxygenase [Luteibacter sp. NPDC031894]|uniref:intradiol ring-cleavage dioxygenase n=1 Tax=Luteibacter sp. NPDC031894 TaxID=3390572 RepID=UPI003D05BA17
MRQLTEESLTHAVLAATDTSVDPRTRDVANALIRHLHAFVREIEPSEAEWLKGIEFLTRTGHTCDANRQEFILLSDTLGVSMLVDAINHRRPGNVTESTVLGPFHVHGAPALPMGANLAEGVDGGSPAFVEGRVLDGNGKPIAGARLDVWQVRPDRLYDVQDPEQPSMQLRAVFHTAADGRYRFRTVMPVSYAIPDDGPVGEMLRALGRHPWRPAHIHFIVSAPGHAPVVTHVFVEDDPYLDSDAVFGVKDSLVVAFEERPPGMAPDGAPMETHFHVAHHDFSLSAR